MTTTQTCWASWPPRASWPATIGRGSPGWTPATGLRWPSRQRDALYDPALDLAVEAADGQIAGYALFWFDPVTEVGLLEPMRVEDAYQRRGLARALLSAGVARLAARGARRLKVGYGTDVAHGLYVGAGFQVTATTHSYSWGRPVRP